MSGGFLRCKKSIGESLVSELPDDFASLANHILQRSCKEWYELPLIVVKQKDRYKTCWKEPVKIAPWILTS